MYTCICRYEVENVTIVRMKVTEKNIITPLAITTVTLFVLDTVARLFYFYWTIWWMDIVNHFIGGMVVTFFFALFPFVRKGSLKQTFFNFLFIIVTVGVLWEVFEFVFGLTNTTEIGYTKDTIIDMIMDTLGMVVAYFYLTKKIKN